MVSLINKHGLKVRPAQLYDAMITYKWAMDPVVRANSINKDEFPFQQHVEWFSRKIVDPKCTYLIMDTFCPAGQIRLDHYPEHYLINFLIDSNFRGLGFAKEIVRMAMEVQGEGVYHAFVKEENIASLKVFRGLEFEELGIDPSNNLIKFIYEAR